MKVLFLAMVVVVMSVSVQGGYQRQYQFQQRSDQYRINRRSDYQDCSEDESQKLKMAASIQLNKNIQQENRQVNFLMPMPELEQKPIVLGKVTSCQKAELQDGGYSFKMKVEGVQNGQTVYCDIQGIHDLDASGVQLDNSQCQGSSE